MILETERLSIRPLQQSDHPALLRLSGDFAQSPLANYDSPFPLDPAANQRLTEFLAATGLFFAVSRKDLSEMIGFVCFHRNGDTFDLGYRFHSAHHGNGFAFEACTAMMEHIRQQFHPSAFTAGTALDNLPSCRLLAKLGFTLQRTELVSFRQTAAGEPIQFTGGCFRKKLSQEV